jgi:putative ABC transport system permease protein
MRTLSLAARNLLRNRRRSIATLAAIAIGGASILLFGGYTTNIRYSLETSYVRNGGHLQVQHKDLQVYGNGNPTAYSIRDVNKIIEAIKGDEVLGPSLIVVTPTLMFSGIAGNYTAGVSRTVFGLGVVAKDYNKMRSWNYYSIPVISPPFALDGAKPDAAIIGQGVARVLQLCEELKVADCPAQVTESSPKGAALPADIAALTAGEASSQSKAGATPKPSTRRIELLASSPKGTPNVASLEVIAAEGQGFKELDDIYIGTQLEQAQRLVFGSSTPKVTAIILQLKSPSQAKAAEARIREKLPSWSGGQPLAVLDIETLNPFFVQTVALFATLFAFIFSLIGGIVLFTVSNTMNTAVVERTVEVGTLRAIGLRQAGIRRMFMAEGVMLGVAGAVAGVVFALLISGFINLLGLEWFPPGSAESLPLVLRVWGETKTIIGVTIGLIVVAIASAWYPAYRAAQLRVVDALRHA